MHYERKPRSHTVQFNHNHQQNQYAKRRGSHERGLGRRVDDGGRVMVYETSPPKTMGNIVKYFSNRDSGKLDENHHARKRKPTMIEMMKNYVKGQLQKLSYREKLYQVEGLIRKAKHLCRNYGYFYLTCAMFSYNPEDDIKVCLWVHPDPKIQKPLHPIIKATEFQCELEFIISFKNSLKGLFPTINFGKSKTFISLEKHLHELARTLDSKTKKSHISYQKPSSNSFKKGQTPKTNFSFNTSLPDRLKITKAYTTISASPNSHFIEEQARRHKFKNQNDQKQTKSTLLQSMKSNNSIKEKMKMLNFHTTGGDDAMHWSQRRERKTSRDRARVQDPTLSGKIHYKLSQLSEQPQDYKNSPKQSYDFKKRTEKRLSTPRKYQPNPQKQFQSQPPIVQQPQLQEQKSISPNTSSRPSHRILTDQQKKQMRISLMKRSKLNKNMTTSVQIQSQLNNLFGDGEFAIDEFYQKLPEGRVVRNSVLSKVAEEFEELLF